MNAFSGVVKTPVSELAKVLEDMRTAPSVRRKLYFVSPLLTALLFGVYERLGLRRVKTGLVAMTRPPGPTAVDFARQSADRIRALGLEKLEVLAGPFKGMRYGDFSHNSALIPKLLGTYESDLHGWVAEAIAAGYDAVINIGCAEGYYAVGFAYADPALEVVAFDTSGVALDMMSKLATLNGLQDRIRVADARKPVELEGLLRRYKRPLLFVDIEGAEDDLLDIRRAPTLAAADMIVETHDGYNFGVTRRLIERFWPTHRFEITGGREAEDQPLPAIVRERIPDPAQARELLSESRGLPELWLRFRARHSRDSRSGDRRLS
jgi:hypothetical protein